MLYDLEYHDYVDDIDWYTALGQRARAPVLELACGNGRLTLPLARGGVEVVGVDLSAPMLASLRSKLLDERPEVQARVQLHYGSFLAIPLEQRFSTVILPFNALHHCEDHRAVLTLLDEVRRVLSPGGIFALDCYLPDPTLYQRDFDEVYGERVFVDPRDGSLLQSWEQSWYDPIAQVHHVTYAYQRPDGRVDRADMHLRMYYPAELRGLFDLAGWRIQQAAKDFEGGEVDVNADRYVLLLTPA